MPNKPQVLATMYIGGTLSSRLVIEQKFQERTHYPPYIGGDEETYLRSFVFELPAAQQLVAIYIFRDRLQTLRQFNYDEASRLVELIQHHGDAAVGHNAFLRGREPIYLDEREVRAGALPFFRTVSELSMASKLQRRLAAKAVASG